MPARATPQYTGPAQAVAAQGAGSRRPALPLATGRPGSFEAAVHLGFAVLLVASVVRYVMRHSPADNLLVLGLAIAACLLYAVAALLSVRDRRGTPWMVALVAIWAVLVVAAPSFAWCSFALFFLCRSALRGAASYVLAGAITVATAAGLFRLGSGTDLAMLLGPLAVGVMLTLIYDRIQHDAEEQRRLHADLVRAQEELATSERRAGTIAERERVSREIHDTVTQGLASSLLLLEAAGRGWPGEPARVGLLQATSLLRANLAETRGLVHELASPGLESVPLPEALLATARQYVPGATLLVTGEPLAVSPEVRHALLRVAQSAASNILLHAAAPATTVTLGFVPDAVTLDIYDDGAGFDPAAAAPPSHAGGYGLRAMRQRVEQLGGTFSVQSAPGEGTIVAAQFPLDVGP